MWQKPSPVWYGRCWVTDTGKLSRLQRYERLLEISRDLASTLDLDSLLKRIVQAAADLSNAEAASILLYDQSNEQLYFQAASNLDEPAMRGLVVPVESSIAGWIVTRREAVIIPDVSQDPRHFGQVDQSTHVQTRSLLGVPLITKDKVLGVLEAINKREDQFTQEDLELLNILGAQAAVAIENTRLFQQSDLISDMVHELRTPLASLNAAIFLLQHPGATQEQRDRVIRTMSNEINRLAEMATSFLDLAKLESGRMPFQHDRVNLRQLLEESGLLVRSTLQEKQQSLEMTLPEDMPIIAADSDKIKQVIINLLSNAHKYTPEGGVIRLNAGYEKDCVWFSVADNGPGIPERYLPRLFEKFFRVPGSEKSAAGTGLGLSICKRIVETHRGRIEVNSRENEGTTFTVYLPR